MAEAAAVAESEVYDRAARGLRRRPSIPTALARRTRRAAGGLRGMEFVRTADTRRLLQTLDQLNRLSLTLAVLREQQGRTAQATAARRTAELLGASRPGAATPRTPASAGWQRRRRAH